MSKDPDTQDAGYEPFYVVLNNAELVSGRLKHDDPLFSLPEDEQQDAFLRRVRDTINNRLGPTQG